MRNALLWMMIVFASCSTLWSQEGSDAFSNLGKYINQEVTVETPEGKLSGQLLRVEESRLVVYRNGSPNPIAQESIRKVTRHRARHTTAWIGVGAAAGLGWGLLIGMYAFHDTTNASSKIATFTAAEAGIGGAAGYGLSRIGRNQVIYESPEKAVVQPYSRGIQRNEPFETQTSYLYRSTKLACVSCVGSAMRGPMEESSRKTLPASGDTEQEVRDDVSGLGDSIRSDAPASVGRMQ